MSSAALVVGDSIVDGYYASDSERGLASLVGDGLDAALQVVAVPGVRAFRVAAAGEDATPRPADVVVVGVGVNDVGKSTLQDWADGYRRLLTVVTTSPGRAGRLLGTPERAGPLVSLRGRRTTSVLRTGLPALH